MNHDFEMTGFHAICITPLYSLQNEQITFKFDVWSHIYTDSSINSFVYNISIQEAETTNDSAADVENMNNDLINLRQLFESNITSFNSKKRDAQKLPIPWSMYLIDKPDSKHEDNLMIDLDSIILIDTFDILRLMAISLHKELQHFYSQLKTHDNYNYKTRNTIGNQLKKQLDVQFNKLILVYEGGSFMYPGVAINFTRLINLQKVCENSDTSDGCATVETEETEETEETADASKQSFFKMKTISLKPVVFEIDNFLSENERNGLIELISDKIGPKFHRSNVENSESYNHWRTSLTAWIEWTESRLNNLISLRISDILKIAISNQETTQVLRYGANEKYGMHLDYFSGKEDEIKNNFGNRVATALWYMNDCCSNDGGYTIFPMFNKTEIDKIYNLYSIEQCLDFKKFNNSLLVKPQAGKIVIFYNLNANGDTDRYSLHGACPVGKDNVKYAANKWLWNVNQHKFDVESNAFVLNG